MPQDLPPSRATGEPDANLISRLVEAYNPGVTFLVAVWIAGFACRQMLQRRGLLADTADEALMSLLYVVPIMLAGWGVLSVVQRITGARFFDRRD